MTSRPISSLVLPALAGENASSRLGTLGGRQRLKLSPLRAVRASAAVYDLSTIDQWGRVVARSAVAALGWTPGNHLSVTENRGLIIAVRDEAGVSAMNSQGHLRLPLSIRQWSGLNSGTRMLVVGDPQEDRLVIHPPSMLDEMIGQVHRSLLGGAV